ncbi:hypothetical protein GLW20_06795 [Virgibacillus halodenitrificans]|nr:hypothetical protein [Virgibacillus halodenitrificans]
MNFETRYLIRWGVPGWVFIITIGIYLGLIEYGGKEEMLSNIISNAPNLLATAAFLIIIGIPVGYILNQVHHVWIWVIRVDWDTYFQMEQEITKIMSISERSVELQNRYRYLLNRVHELGGLFVALTPTLFILFFYHLLNRSWNTLTIMYFVLLFIISTVIFLSRNYYRRNLDAFTKDVAGKEYNSIINPVFRRIRNSKLNRFLINKKNRFLDFLGES